MSKSYEVQARINAPRFATLAEASGYANEIYQKRGIIVGVVASDREPTHRYIGD